MLGVVAVSFFVFGLMVGNLTSASRNGRTETAVSGLITFKQGSDYLPDADAVVMILPANQRPDERSKAVDVHPQSFEPLENPGIDRVYALGGAIVRAGEDGRFRVVVDGPQKFNVLVVSNHTARNEDDDERDQLTKSQRASVADFFFPVDKAIGDQRVYWTTFDASNDSYELPEVKFD